MVVRKIFVCLLQPPKFLLLPALTDLNRRAARSTVTDRPLTYYHDEHPFSPEFLTRHAFVTTPEQSLRPQSFHNDPSICIKQPQHLHNDTAILSIGFSHVLRVLHPIHHINHYRPLRAILGIYTSLQLFCICICIQFEVSFNIVYFYRYLKNHA